MFARWISVAGAIALFRIRRSLVARHDTHCDLGWLWGGISVAVALSLAEGASRDLLLTMTYAVVVFSITAQELTIVWLRRRLYAKPFEGHYATPRSSFGSS
jgi:CPA1 family monovalent cation:H+ antiporter